MAQDYPQPEIKTSKVAYTVWLLPLIALILAIFLIYKNINDRGINIFIEFPDANGIIAKKTAVKFRGIEVGRVMNLTALQDGSGILASIEMQQDTRPYLTDKLKFWLVKPDVGFSGISGLDTLLSGAYIQVDGGQEVLDGNATRYFKALTGAPQLEIPEELDVFTLVTNNAAGVTNGSLVYHRNIVVGGVRHVKLSDDHQAVEVTVAIEPEYKGLVKMNSRFWNVSGVKASFDLSGVKMQMGGFIPMLVGGLAFSSPDGSQPAAEFTEFRLYSDADAARDSLEIKLKFPSDAPVRVGTAIMLDRQKVGSVDTLSWDDNFEHLTGMAKLSMEMTSLMRPDTEFWLESPGLSVDSVDVTGLLRGTIIRLSPGLENASKPVRSFEVLDESPYKRWAKQGLHLSLVAADADGIAQGTGVYYKSEAIGQVEWVDFDPVQKQFLMDVLIFPRYRKMLNSQTRFYNLSGIEFSAELQQGIKMNMPSLTQLINGGIGVQLESGEHPQLEKQSKLPLYKNLEAALASRKSHLPSFALHSQDLLSPAVNSPVYYKQFEIGKVIEVTLADEGSHSTVVVSIEPRFTSLMRQNNRFWPKSMVDVSADLSGVKVSAAPLMSMIAGGIEMELADAAGETVPSGHRFTLYKSKEQAQDNYRQIALTITRQTTLKAGAEVKYRGHTVGKVTETALMPDLKGIRATVKLKGEYAEHFTRSGSRYWLVQPNIRLNGIQNVAAGVFGDHLGVEKGDGDYRDHFVVDKSNLYTGDGLSIVLKAPQLGSLDPGDPVLYKQLRIGEVTAVGLAEDNQEMAVNVMIYPDYRHLVSVQCKFWNAGGIKLDAGLFSGVKVDTQTLESIVAGGIAMAISPGAPEASEGQSYPLFSQAQEDWLDGVLNGQ